MIGKNLQKIRESKELGVNELSRLAGVNASYISAIERGTKSNPSPTILNKLADALGVSTDEFFKDGTDKEINNIEQLAHKDITSVEDALKIIESQEGLMLKGEILTDDDKILLANALQLGMKYVLEKKNKNNK